MSMAGRINILSKYFDWLVSNENANQESSKNFASYI